jgi:3-hydroxyisobutyrate dehydrogenase-like beta-hydroxyacid dehydrogenase
VITVGMVGLGEMGLAMAQRLIEQGYSIVGYDPNTSNSAHARELGVDMTASPAVVARRSEVLLLNVRTVDHAEAAIHDDDGLLGQIAAKTLVVMSTLGSEAVERLAAEVGGAGGVVLDAPHSGSKPAARSGALVFFVAGTDSAVEQAQPVLAELGSRVYRVGNRPGLGQVIKVANAVGLAFNMSAVVEMQRIVELYGIDSDSALNWLEGASGSSWLSNRMPGVAGMLLEHHIDNLEKDLLAGLLPVVAAGQQLPVTSAILATLRSQWLGRD